MNQPIDAMTQELGPRPLGTLVGDRYELRRILGRGGAAVVYAAEHVRVRRSVALKLPLTEPGLREILSERLRRETEALAKVRHPVIVDVIDAGESDGLPFLAMELLEGRTLSGLIAARGRLDCKEAVKAGILLAEGLAAVHATGLVHRDVKPSNVLVTSAPADQIHLCDFGLAKPAGSAAPAPSDAKLTAAGAVVGTPEYMPMETLVSADEADHRADVYSLGVLLFECLTGAVPFEGTLAQVIMQLTTSRPPAVSDVRTDVPVELSRVVARCLEQEPAGRFASMTEVAAALRACVSQPLHAIDLLRAEPERATVPVVAQVAAAAPRPSFTARREHARAPYVTVATLQRDGGPSTSARVEDISEGGVLLISEQSYEAGESVRLRFSLPISGRVISLRATVRWFRKARTAPATGLEFADLPEAPRAEIRRYVELMGSAAAKAR
jgi:serine/threonine-protein kinase